MGITNKDNPSTLLKTAKDVLPKTTNVIDSTVSTLLGVVDSVLFYPLKKANLMFKYKLDSFENDLKQKTSKIPEEHFQMPKISILGPTLEALKYTIDEKMLRDMYINLLAASMDKRNDNIVHPSYIDIIKRMSPVDAKIFSSIAFEMGYIPIINPTACIKNTNRFIPGIFPEWFFPINGLDIYEISASLVRLSKLGVLELLFDRSVSDDNLYNPLRVSPILTSILNDYKSKMVYLYSDEIIIKLRKSSLYINDYGKGFAKICIAK